MAYANQVLVSALRETAKQLREGAPYAWGNHGSCNCGHLLQVISGCSRAEILRYTQSAPGEWTELARSYCPVSDAPIDLLLSKLQAIGLTPTDIHNLEYLEDRAVLDKLPGGFRWLRKNVRDDVILYFETFASLLARQLEVRCRRARKGRVALTSVS